MSDSKPFSTLSAFGSLASILAFLGLSFTNGLPWQGTAGPSSATNEEASAPFELSGNVSTDVQRALILLGQLDGVPGDSRAPHVKQAIERAEKNLGLPPDGSPDNALLSELRIKIENGGLVEGGAGGGSEGTATSFLNLPLQDWHTVAQIGSLLSGILLAWVTFVSARGRKEPEPS